MRQEDLRKKYPTAYALRCIAEQTHKDHMGSYFAKDSIRSAIRTLALQQEGLSLKDYQVFFPDEEMDYPQALKQGIDDVLKELTVECAEAFEEVMYTLVIDYDRDPNSFDTPLRLAKMFIHELMHGRYHNTPKVTSFPNDNQNGNEEKPSKEREGEIFHFNNLLCVQAPFVSVCSHHWQPVNGTAYIGIIPGKKIIGLSKYTRVVQHIAARGTLQEELTVEIANALQEHTETEDIAVTVFARHGCCENRGIRVPNSNTSTAEMRGLFMEKGKLREEFYDNVKMMRRETHD